MSALDAVLEPPPVEAAINKSETGGPYKGLDYYRDIEQDTLRFSGRETDIFELIARVATSRVVVIYGRSGLGKTSLLLAGLFPAIREQGYLPVYVRTLQHPLDDLKSAIRTTTCHIDNEAPLELKALVEAAATEKTLLLVLDQFEEFFIRFKNQPDRRVEFVTALTDVICDKDCDVRVIFSLREDYLAALDDFQRALPDLFADAYRLLPLTPLAARQAIVGPLKQDNIQYDEQLVSQLVDALARFDFDSARLQIVCTELYRSARKRAEQKGDEAHATRATRLTSDDLKELRKASGDLEGVFRRYTQAAIENIPDDRHPLARALLDLLITRGDTKYAISRSELFSFKLGADADLDLVLERLVTHNVIRQERRGNDEWYELIHECLVPEIKRWLDENADFANFRLGRELITFYSTGGRFREQKELLLSPPVLSNMISPHRERFRLTPLQNEFVLWSSLAAQAGDIPFWLEKLESDKTVPLLRDLLGHKDPDLRTGAAIATRCCVGPERQFLTACMELALDGDQPANVRRAAGQTIALVADEDELACIKNQLRFFRRTPPHIRELLADLEEKDRVRTTFGRWRAKAARRWLGRRLLEKNRADSGKASVLGAMRGLLAAVCWSLTSGVLYSVLFDWICNPFPGKHLIEKMYWYVAWPIMPGIFLGALIGWRLSRLSLQTAVILGKNPWEAVIRRSNLLRLILGLPAVAVIFSIVDLIYQAYGIRPPQAFVFLTFAFILLVAWVLTRPLRFLIARAAAAVSHCLDGSAGWRVVWTVVPNIALAIVLPVILLTLVTSVLPDTAIDYLVNSDVLIRLVLFGIIIVLIGSFLLFVATATLGTVPVSSEADATAQLSRKWKLIRGYFAFGAFLLVPWFIFTYGLRTIPLTLWYRSLPPSHKLMAKLRMWPETNYIFRKTKTSSPLFRATLPGQASITINGRNLGTRPINQDVNLFIPSPYLDIAVGNTLTGHRDPVEITLVPVPLHEEYEVPYDGTTVYFECQLSFASEQKDAPPRQSLVNAPGPRRWQGELRKRFVGYKYDSTDKVEITINRRSVFKSNRTFTLTVKDLKADASKSSSVRTSGSFEVEGGEVGVYPMAAEQEAAGQSMETDIAFPREVGISESGEWAVGLSAELETEFLPSDRGSISVLVGARVHNLEATELYDAGRRALRQNKLPEATDAFAKAFSKNPRSSLYANELAWNLYQQRKNNEAYDIAAKAVELDPRDFHSWDTFAHIAYETQRWKEADDAWTKVKQLSPKFFDQPPPSCLQDLEHQQEARANAAPTPSPSP
jgi:hypothetical protein